MNAKKIIFLCWLITLMSIVILIAPSLEPVRAQAQIPTPLADYGGCIKCHENLYFLHDTGNWFCIRESPMGCVDCHGGDPSTLRQVVAHASRKAHPIINEDVSKCQECHPAECDERVRKFDQVAGISNVLVAFPYQPISIVNSEQSHGKQTSEPTEHHGWISAIEIVTPILISGLVLVIYLLHHKRQNKPINRSHK
jgi:hypothetical protein